MSAMLEAPPSSVHELRRSAEWRRNISATASALLDCQDDADCVNEEVATIVVTDIQEQRRQQVGEEMVILCD